MPNDYLIKLGDDITGDLRKLKSLLREGVAFWIDHINYCLVRDDESVPRCAHEALDLVELNELTLKMLASKEMQDEKNVNYCRYYFTINWMPVKS